MAAYVIGSMQIAMTVTEVERGEAGVSDSAEAEEVEEDDELG